MKLTLYQIDAFADKIFAGNPAAVCPLTEWLPDDVMQAVAMENNLSETAFFVPNEEGYQIRWFTPMREVPLCGHATLASAYVLFTFLGYSQQQIVFQSLSGQLTVERRQDWLEMDFPAQAPTPCELPPAVIDAFAEKPVDCLKNEDYIVVFADEDAIVHAEADFSKLAELDLRGIAITAPSNTYDFVTRFFAPKYGIDEDPVTGSAFTQLIPYWADRLGKTELQAKQVSKRGGMVRGRLSGERVKIAGKAVAYLIGTIEC